MSGRRARLQRFIFYTAGTLLQKGGQFLLLPLLIGSMSADEFARYGLFTAATFILVPLLSLNVHMAGGRLFFDRNDHGGRASLMISLLSWGLVLVVGGVLLLGGLLLLIGAADPLTLGQPLLVILIGLSIASAVLVQFYGLLFRLVDKPALFAMVSGLLGFGLLGAYAVTSRVLDDKLVAAVVAYLLTNVVTVLIAAIPARPYLGGGRWEMAALRPAASYGSGTMVQNVVTWVNGQSGRWIGTLTMPVAALAGYTLMSYVAMAANLVAMVLFETMRIDIMKSHVDGAEDRSRRLIDRTVFVSFALVLLVYMAVFGLQRVQDGLLPPGYHIDTGLVLAAAAFSLLQIVFLRAFWLATSHKRTKTLATVMVLAAIVTLFASWLLAREYGDLGLMVGAAVGALLQAVAGNLLMARILRTGGRAEGS
ncbi:hypothetical protein V6768_20320 [Tistrella mobilis]|jgi:O-antigen/teichoic acid export membrane protein